MAKGLDVGTAFIVGARKIDKETKFFSIRDAFFKMPPGGLIEQMLINMQISYVKPKGKNDLYIIGDEAMEFALKFQEGILNRPMAAGTVNKDETEAVEILKIMFKSVLGSPSKMNEEMLYYSVPADPVDSERDTIYHGDVLEIILGRYDEDPKSEYKGLGYKVKRMNEASAIVFSELADYDYTGMAISFGAGMVNVCLSFMSAPVMNFSVVRSGDYIDKKAAQESGLTPTQICQIKEREIDLRNVDYSKQGHGQIYIYYRNLLKYVIGHICNQFQKTKQGIAFGSEIPIVVSGGTSKVPGFEEMFEEIFMEAVNEGKFPLKPSKVIKAKDPLTAVANGCYLCAEMEENK